MMNTTSSINSTPIPLPVSMTNIKMFNDKMILSTAKDSKNIQLWAENSGTIAFTYTDDNLKKQIPKDQIIVIGKHLYSEYFIYLQENKSLFTIWSTDSTQFYSKFSVSDERIASIDLSSDAILLSIATITGMVYFYDLSVGFLLKSSQISKAEIYSIKQYDNFFFVLDKDRLCSYLIGKIFTTPNDIQPKEIHVHYQTEAKFNHMLVLSWCNTIIIWNSNMIMLLSIPDLTPIKTFRLNSNTNSNSNKLIENLTVKFVCTIDIYFTSKNELHVIETANYSKKETHQLNYDNNSSLLVNDNTKGALSDITAFSFGTKWDNIITGHDDGKIRLWSRMPNKLFTMEGMYHNIHKGPVMNILVINKPISQYGLNFNKAIHENIISKTQVKEPNEVPIKLIPEYESYVDDIVSDYTNSVIEKEIMKRVSNQGANANADIEMNKEDKGDISTNKASSALNNYLKGYLD